MPRADGKAYAPEQARAASRRWRERHKNLARARVRADMKGRPRHTSRESKTAWEQRNPEKVKAHRILNGAIRRGKMNRPETCEYCGTEPGVNKAGVSLIHGHHHDYAKPLEVLWLCADCHKRMNRLEVTSALESQPA